VNPDFELERASRRPTDHFCRLIGKEDMGDEPEDQADKADIQYQGIEKQKANDADTGPRLSRDGEMRQGKHNAQESDQQADHLNVTLLLTAARATGLARRFRSKAWLRHCRACP
jgi:hypothetical protein